MSHPAPLPLVSYYRVSTDRQGRSGLGLDAQRETVRRHAKRLGGRVVAEFTDVMSGRKRFRPQLHAAFAQARHSKATIIVAKLDRLARDVALLLDLVDAGVPVVFGDLPELATGDPIVGRLVLTVLAAIAEFESRRIGQRIKEALAVARRRGARFGAHHPIVRRALRRANRHRRAEAKAWRAEVRPLILPLRRRGLWLTEIAAALNAKGHRTWHDKPWTYATVWHVLQD